MISVRPTTPISSRQDMPPINLPITKSEYELFMKEFKKKSPCPCTKPTCPKRMQRKYLLKYNALCREFNALFKKYMNLRETLSKNEEKNAI